MKALSLKACVFFLIAICTSCLDDNSSTFEIPDFREQNDATITQYIADNNLTATKTESGLYYIINEPGTGAHPTATDDVTVTYKGYYTNGAVFEEPDNENTFNLSGVIQGWTEGIQYLKEGGSATLLIPAHLGYGSFNFASIPGGSVLIFDVELIAIN